VAEVGYRCSFCDKEPRDFEMMVEAPARDVRICNECTYLGMVALAQTPAIDFGALVAAAKPNPVWTDVEDS
jgi:hypothetical protein